MFAAAVFDIVSDMIVAKDCRGEGQRDHRRHAESTGQSRTERLGQSGLKRQLPQSQPASEKQDRAPIDFGCFSPGDRGSSLSVYRQDKKQGGARDCRNGNGHRRRQPGSDRVFGTQDQGQQTGNNPQRHGDQKREQDVLFTPLPFAQRSLALGNDPIGSRNFAQTPGTDANHVQDEKTHHQ